jgi:hypothetical protein
MNTGFAAMLYSHALESIFAFCTLKELAAVVCVNHSWQESVLRMRAIQGSVRHDGYTWKWQMCASPWLLRRHLVDVNWGWGIVSTKEQVVLLHEQLPQLTILRLQVRSRETRGLSWSFPENLQLLSLYILDMGPQVNYSDTPEEIVMAITKLRKLVKLALVSRIMPSLQPLVEMSQLRCLTVSASANQDTLRQMRHLHELVQKPLKNTTLRWAPLLRPGHQLQLRTVRVTHADKDECAALASLPSLTSLTLEIADYRYVFHDMAQHRQLPQLTELCIRDSRIWYKTECCLLNQLPQLRKLSLYACGSLGFAYYWGGNGDVPNHSLVSLVIHNQYPRLAVDQLTYLLNLQALESLDLTNVFTRELTFAEAVDFSSQMPALRNFVHSASLV